MKNSKHVLIPRNLEGREERWKQITYQKIQNYIKNGSKGNLNLRKTPITKLPDNLIKVEGFLDMRNSKIKNLNNLKYVGGFLGLDYTSIESLPDNLMVEGNLLLIGSKIKHIPFGLYVKGGVMIKDEIYNLEKDMYKFFSNRPYYYPINYDSPLELFKTIVKLKGGKIKGKLINNEITFAQNYLNFSFDSRLYYQAIVRPIGEY